jgi:hypothetical protein
MPLHDPPARGEPVPIGDIGLRDIIQQAEGPGVITRKEITAGENAPILLGWRDLLSGRNGYATYWPAENVLLLGRLGMRGAA